MGNYLNMIPLHILFESNEEYQVPLKEKKKEKHINPKTGRLKNKKLTKYMTTDIPPEKRTLKNIPKYSTGKSKVRFQDWLCLKKSPNLYDKHNDISWGWSPNGKCYGWSHRAVYGFNVGFKITKNTCGNTKKGQEWIIKTEKEAEMMAKLFAKDVS